MTQTTPMDGLVRRWQEAMEPPTPMDGRVRRFAGCHGATQWQDDHGAAIRFRISADRSTEAKIKE